MKSPILKNIVWAVDTAEPLEFQQNSELLLGALNRGTSLSVYPVHVCGRLSEAKATGIYEEAYQALAEKRMQQITQNSESPRLHQGKVLICRGYGLRTAVKALIDYAEEKKADAILASTHSLGVVEKFFLGSFVETLLLQSRIPLITVNPTAKVREKIQKVLLPSTFDEKFRPAFEEAVRFCKDVGADLTVLYKEPYIPMIDISYELLRLLEAEAESRKAEADRYRELAQSYHVALEVRFDTKPGHVAEAIVSCADEHNFDLIAMVSQTSQFAPAVGNICRKVVRRAKCPVWTFRADDYTSGEIE